MADIISSLFGIETPNADTINDYRTKQGVDLGTLWGQATANQYASPERRNAYIQQQGAIAGLANKGVRALGGLFGVKDPMLERANTLEAILQETQQELGADAQDPVKMYGTLYNKLSQGGFSKEAMQVGQLAQKAQQEQGLNAAKIDNEVAQSAKYRAEATKALREGNPIQALFFKMAEKSSPQSVQKALQAGMDISLLDSPDVTKFSPLAQQLIDAGFKYGTPEFAQKMMEFLEAEKAGKSKGSGNVNVSLGGVNIDAKKVSEEAGKITGKDAVTIQEQYSQLEDFMQAKDMLKAGIFTGPFAEKEYNVAKYTRQNLKKVERTEVFKSHIANNVIKRLKDIGGNDTKEERDYLEAMLAGNITYEPEAILRMIESGEKKVRDKITRTQQQVESASTGSPIPLSPILQEGQTGVSKTGKPIVVKGGKWVYK